MRQDCSIWVCSDLSFSQMLLTKLFTKDYVGYCVDTAYKKLMALNNVAFDKGFWEDIQSDGVGGYIERGTFDKNVRS